jgi:hypothetical protein
MSKNLYRIFYTVLTPLINININIILIYIILSIKNDQINIFNIFSNSIGLVEFDR